MMPGSEVSISTVEVSVRGVRSPVLTAGPPDGGYFAQVRRAWLLSVMVFPSGHALSWLGPQSAAGSG
jgi:hypothetical protein